jgi:DNA-binding response OmpR family regulator
MILPADGIDSTINSDAPSRFKIILVEDDNELRNGITDYLSRVGFEVVPVRTGLAFYHALAEQSFQLAIIDIGLPDISGFQLADYIHKNMAMRCIILTARDSVDEKILGYESGADIYMVKPVDCRELTAAITQMLKRDATKSQTGNHDLSWRLYTQNSTLISPDNTLILLTSRELDFLIAITPTGAQVVSRDDILSSMGYSLDYFAQNALESLVRRLRRKIEQSVGSSPILTRHGIGYSFSDFIVRY